MDRKRVLGQFFTKDKLWLKPHIADFIRQSNCHTAYDPFAGAGDLLKASIKIGSLSKFIGLDIDDKLNWIVNDSLVEIPHVDNAIIITNPPYISNYSASRKGLGKELKKYFSTSSYPDVYLIALDKMLRAQKQVVAIIPETFINSSYKLKNLLNSITVLEENPFNDTENPVIVACFDGEYKNLSQVKVYKNDHYVNSLGAIEQLRLKPKGSVDMTFNDPNGWLAVRCVDTTNPANKIKFGVKDEIAYDWGNRIKASSRLLTLIDVNIPTIKRSTFINQCNTLLALIRKETSDIILSPFKGNMKDGCRRRRLDFKTCRAIIEQAYNDCYTKVKNDQSTSPYALDLSKRSNVYAQQQALFRLF